MKAYAKVEGYYNCNDCGTYNKVKEQIKHYNNCKDGECKKCDKDIQ